MEQYTIAQLDKRINNKRLMVATIERDLKEVTTRDERLDLEQDLRDLHEAIANDTAKMLDLTNQNSNRHV